MSPFRSALANAKLAILLLLIGLLLSFILNVFLGVLLYRVPKDMTVFVPPVIGKQGLSTKAGQLSNAAVYRFTYSTWVSLMTWTGNGIKAFPKNLQANAPFISVPFQNTLKAQMAAMNSEGFLYGHSQVSFGVNGSSYDPKNVKYIGNGTYLVRLVIRTTNYVNGRQDNAGFSAAHLVRDATTSFIFKVARFPVIKGFNTSGLKLIGFAAKPKVIKIYQ